MNTAILFSGGKDSCLALNYAMQFSNVKCLISIHSTNPESYMFHTPNIQYTTKQAEAIGIPILIQKTTGVKEEELKDLENAIRLAKEKYHIQGIVTGAIESVYQASRVQAICDKLDLECFNPLWQKDQNEILNELVIANFEVIIVGVFAEGMDSFLGKNIDAKFIHNIQKAKAKYLINVAGEGGEFESFVLDGPFFKQKLEIKKSVVKKDSTNAKILIIEELKTIKK